MFCCNNNNNASGSPAMHRVAGLSGALAVAMGAFGAHALKAQVTAEQMDVWKTAATYHLAHSVLLAALQGHKRHATSSKLILAGTTLFSGSLYLLVLTGVKKFGAVTPLGGVALILGWLAAAYESQ
jgi:uncharacterized membrane protein YgdD (TMEM256/DUF423 family)